MKVTPFICSKFLSDGGVMFGMVPKPLWSRLIAPDEQNRIPQHANTLLIELNDGQKGIIDTGCGDPMAYPEKTRTIQGLNEPWPLQASLDHLQIRGEDIDFILFTHLHWDHVSGLNDAQGKAMFPKADLYVHADEWRNATNNELLRSAYPLSTLRPLRESLKLKLFHGDQGNLLEGIDFTRSSGHTEGHCTFTLYDDEIELIHPESEGLGKVTRILYCGDACPTQHHLKEKYYPSYDLFPLASRAWKRNVLPDVEAQQDLVIFSHDPVIYGGTLKVSERAEFLVDFQLRK